MNAMVEDPLLGECLEHECEGCAERDEQIRVMRNQVALLKIELAKTRCRGCGKALPIGRTVRRCFCSIDCWVEDTKQANSDLEW